MDYVDRLRAAEIARIARRFEPSARILEIGAGTGLQTRELRRLGFDVEALDVGDSLYAAARVVAVTDYDGRSIPFADASFDIVFSSNVLEHIGDLRQAHAEIRRVLKTDGRCIHVLPTHVWRFWTTVSGFPVAARQAIDVASQPLASDGSSGSVLRSTARRSRAIARRLRAPFFPGRHGDVGNAWTELWRFHPRAWRLHFEQHGFEVVHEQPMGLFYTGHLALGARCSLQQRERLAARLGSACHLFELRARPALRVARRAAT